MKKLLLFALGCGLAFTAVACSDESDEDLAQRYCEHMVECGMPGYDENTCSQSSGESTSKDDDVTVCKSESKSVLSCQADAKCEDLKAGTECVKQKENVAKCIAKSMMGGLGGLF